MKDFFKNVFATFVGIFLFVLVTLLLGFVCIFGMVLSSESTTEIENNSVLVINLSGPLSERSDKNVMAEFIGNVASGVSLEDVLSGIEKAKTNKNIKGIYIEAGAFALPSIVTDINGSREIITNEVNGLIIPSQNIEALTQAMQTLLHTPHLKSMGEAAYRNVQQHFSKALVWQQLKDYYQHLLQ